MGLAAVLRAPATHNTYIPHYGPYMEYGTKLYWARLRDTMGVGAVTLADGTYTIDELIAKADH